MRKLRPANTLRYVIYRPPNPSHDVVSQRLAATATQAARAPARCSACNCPLARGPAAEGRRAPRPPVWAQTRSELPTGTIGARGRGRNPWHQLYTDVAKRRQEPDQGRRRAQDPDRRLARAVPPATLQARRPAPARSCLGKLPLLSGRLTALHGIEKPRQLPRTLCADPSAEREMSPPQTRPAPRIADPPGGP